MAQFIKVGERKWRVRYESGRHSNGKRRVINKTVKGTKADARAWAFELEKERSRQGTVRGLSVISPGEAGGCLYALRMCIPNYENCPIKIGFSTLVENRRKALSGAGPFPVEWIGSWPAVSGRFSETAFHERFSQYRLKGEWFFPHPDLIEAVESALRIQAAA